MFIRTKQDPERNRTRVQIVQSVRRGNKVSQKVVRHVGIACSEAEVADLKRLAGCIQERLEFEGSPQTQLLTPMEYADLAECVRTAPRPARLGTDLGECREESRLSLGLRDVMGRVYSDMGWDHILGARRQSDNRIVRELVLARLSQPESKRATVDTLAHRAGITFNLDRVYQIMDYLDEAVIDRICRRSHMAAEKLLRAPLDVLFYDCTTLTFDTEREDPDDGPDWLLSKGYSKDGKPHRSQVMLALVVTTDGLPVGYDLFPGQTWEGHTLEEAIRSLERRYRIGQVTLVADTAMLSKDNRTGLRDKGLPFILGYQMRSASATVQDRILDPGGYQPWAGHGADGKDVEKGRYKVIAHHGGRIFVTWSPSRARNNAHKRHKAIDRLQKKLKHSSSPASVSHQGYARFLAFPEHGEVTLDQDRIDAAARWDGLHAILVHGSDDLTPEAAIAKYHQLWQIKACFRTNKHDLKIRPVYHWTPRRIRAHIAICYMAFCCLQHLRKRMQMIGHPMSPARIRRELDQLQLSVLRHRDTGERYAMPSPVTTDAKRILRCVDLTWSEEPFRMPPERTRKDSRLDK